MKDLSNEIENARINAVQSDFDRREAQGEEMEAEREIEAAEKANNLRADLQYLIKKHSVASVTEMIQELTKPADSFIMIVEQTNVGSTAVVMVTGETANEDDNICTSEALATRCAIVRVARDLGITTPTALRNGEIAYTKMDSKYGNIPAIYFRSENKKTGQKASAKVGWYK